MKTVTLADLKKIRRKRGNRGFTLVELLMVSGVLAVLVAMAIPIWPLYKNMARSSRAMTEIRSLETAINAYVADRGALPPNLEALGSGTPRDPWGNPYRFVVPPTRTFVGSPLNTDYDLYSEGADATHVDSIIDSPDDILRVRDGYSVLLAQKYGL